MNWIARYVAQVKSYLPARDRDDVADEIGSLLEEKQADREQQLGRPLTEPEIFSLLQEFGHPLKVASAYRGTGTLISEPLFPIYLLSIRYLVVILIALYAVSLVVFFVSGRRDLWNFSLGDLIDLGVFYFGAITIGFHLTDRYLQSKKFLSKWKPQELPREDAERESLFSTAFTIIVILVWIRLLSYIPVEHSLDEFLGRNDNRLTTLVLWLKLQAILCVPVYLWLLFRPFWSVSRRAMVIGTDMVGISGALLCLSINGASFAAVWAETFPGWNSSIGIPVASSLILSCMILGMGWDMVNHGYRIWRQLA